MGIIICPIIVGYVVLQRVVRSIKKDPSFSFLKLIFKTKEKKGFEAKLGGDIVALKTAKPTTTRTAPLQASCNQHE